MENKILARKLKFPLIQGGMGVGISLGNLAGAVAKEGGMGTISMVAIGHREEDFYENPSGANKRAFKRELKLAREISQGQGLVGVNIMYALSDYEELLKMAVEEKVDFIISGAGLPLNMPEFVDENILIAPIVSSLKAFRTLVNYWDKKYKRCPDFIVIEGNQAGGHLGFKKIEELDLMDLTREILAYKNGLNKEMDIFVAGSCFDGYDLKKYRELGASGIQIGTRFIATEECDCHEKFKEFIIKSTSCDLRIIKSPVGMLARAVNNKFLEEVRLKKFRIKNCINCLKTCNPATTEFCISQALINSAKGNIEEGLVFAGSNIDRIDRILKVSEIFQEIKKEYEE